MMLISVIRKGAWRRLRLSSTQENYLSILQIFESTNDVVDYQVIELDSNFQTIDRYLSDRQGFSKWKPVSK